MSNKGYIMSYFSKENKANISPVIKEILSKYKLKGSLSVHNHSKLVLKIKSGPIDFIGNYNDTVSNRPGGFRNGNLAEGYLNVNTYWYKEHFSGIPLLALTDLITAMNNGNFDESDIMTDYFHVGWYISVVIGGYNRPYVLST